MVHNLRLTTLLLLALLCVTTAFAQQDTPAPQVENVETEEAPPDQEVEVNEDNYRQFMELKDDLRQRTVIPEESFASRSGLQKLDKLPEESQKHLRNELREIISSGDRWQPGDENADYPYAPSEAAQGNVGLQQQEAEAWGELLDNYHAREAQIYANSARTRAAVAASGALPGQAGDSSGDGESREGEPAQAGQAEASKPGSTGDSFAPGEQNTEGEQSSEGVAQNAMEFLQNAGHQGSAVSSGGAQQQAANTGQDSDQGAEQDQLTNQQSAAAGSATQSESSQAGTSQAAAQTSEGTEQSALEYLQQAGQQQGETTAADSQQAGDGSDSGSADGRQATSTEQKIATADSGEIAIHATVRERDDPNDEGVSQNALEYLAGEGAPAGDVSQDTLSIEDLLNASGVATGVGAEQDKPEELPQEPPD